jgi:GPH family glycoside/pentoside/hexuronide:cation symporter
MSPAASPHATAVPASAPLPLATKLWYTLGQLGEGIKNESFAYFLVFYYTNVLDLPGTLAGVAVAISMLVDSLMDPLMGVISDRTRSRLGRRHPWILASALPLALSLYLVFAPPAGLSRGALFAWMLGWTLVNRFALTMFHVPYLALGAELTRDWNERTVLVSMRWSFAQLAGLFPAVLGLFWLFRSTAEHGDGRLYAPAYPTYAAISAVFVLAAILAAGLQTRKHIPSLAQPEVTGASRSVLGALFHDARELLAQRAFRAVFLGTAISSIASGVTITLGLHAGAFFWDVDSRVMFYWRIVVLVAIVAGLVFWTRRAATHEKGAIFNEGLLWYVAINTVVWTLATAGIWPERESVAYVPLYLLATGFVAPFAVAAVFAVGQSMMADCTDHDEFATGRRREGVFFGASSLAQKLTYGGGALIAGIIIDVVGLTGLKSIEQVTPEMRLHLGLAMTLSVLVLIGLSWFFFRDYDLTRARVTDIHARLAARRSA